MKFRVVWGETKITPIPYSSFTAGPFEMEVDFPPDASAEDIDRLVKKTMAYLDGVARESYTKKLASFRLMLAESQKDGR